MHVSREEMFSLADGDVSSDEKKRLMRHITSCSECERQMKDILAFNESLQQFWNEHLSRECIDEDTMLSYLDGSIERERKAAVDAHLSVCPVCTIKLESGRKAVKELERFEEAVEILLPSIVERLKTRMGIFDVRGILEALGKSLAPSRLGEEFFAFLTRNMEAIAYSFRSPLEVPALLPLSGGGVKLAKTDRGFQRKIIIEEGVPYEVETVQFGDKFILNLKSLDQSHGEAVVRYTLMEENRLRGRGVVLIADGKGSITFNPDEIEALRPEKRPLILSFDVLLKGEILNQIKPEEIVNLIERLQKMLSSGDPEIVETIREAVQRIEPLVQ